MICKNCGRELMDNAMFCEYCGARIEAESAEAKTTTETAAEPLKQYSAPLPGQGQGSAANPSPYDAPVAPYGAAPQSPYQQNPYASGASQAAFAPVKPKKSKTWIIILVVGLLVLCCGGAIAGVLIFNAVNESSKVVIIDNSAIKITVDTKTADDNNSLTWREYEATVENKTDEDYVIYFDYDTVADGVSGSFYIWETDGFGTDFPANETIDATLVIEGNISGDVTNFQGTLVLYDPYTYETIEEYQFFVDSLE